MTILTLSRYQRPIILGLLPLLCSMLIWTPVFADNGATEDPKSSNVKWTTKNDVIIINYDLIGNIDEKYLVTIHMKKENDETFVADPTTAEGDIGEGFFAGNNREIRWYYRRDYPQGFAGKGYYFEIQVKSIGGSSNILYYIAGGAAVIGGLVALIASKNSDGGPPPVVELPLPPVRP